MLTHASRQPMPWLIFDVGQKLKPLPLNLNDYQVFVTEYHGESDRSAVVMAGSFVEHYLATYIRHFMVADKDVDRLFEVGPLSSFDARINIAYAFSLISECHRDDLRVIKTVRNRFAHHPRLITLQREDIRAEIRKLSMWSTLHSDPNPGPGMRDERHVFLFSVGMFVVFVHEHLRKRKMPNKAPEPTSGTVTPHADACSAPVPPVAHL